MTSVQQQMVGIFWLVGGRLIVDASPPSEAEPYGDCLTHRNSHIDYWTGQQRLGTVPCEVECEENPRGRVTYDTKAQKFYPLADRCILKDRNKAHLLQSLLGHDAAWSECADPHHRKVGGLFALVVIGAGDAGIYLHTVNDLAVLSISGIESPSLRQHLQPL